MIKEFAEMKFQMIGTYDTVFTEQSCDSLTIKIVLKLLNLNNCLHSILIFLL